MIKTSPQVNIINSVGPKIGGVLSNDQFDIFSYSGVVEHVDFYNYASFEENFWILDGSLAIPTEGENYSSIFGNQISDESGDLASPVCLTIIFSEPYNINDVYIRFSVGTNEFCDSFDVEVKNESDVVIFSNSYFPDSPTFNFDCSVSSAKKISFCFNSTNNPYRRVRVENISFEDRYEMLGSVIKSGKVIEQISPISTELYMNTFDFEISATDNLDDTIEIPGIGTVSLPENTTFDVYEIYGASRIYLGRFYLSKWESAGTKTVKIYSLDCVKFLGDTFIDGLMSGYQIPYLYYSDYVDLNYIMQKAGIDYYINTAFSDGVSGWIDTVCSYRDIIRRRMFAMFGVATASRSDKLNIKKSIIYPVSENVNHVIVRSDEKIIKTETRKKVDGVRIFAYSFDLSAYTTETVFSGDVNNGEEYTIILRNGPYLGYSYSGGPVSGLVVKNFYMKFTAGFSGTLVLTSNRLTISEREYTSTTYNEANSITIDSERSVHFGRAPGLANRLYDYMQRRIVQRSKIYGINPKLNDSVVIYAPGGQKISGYVERCEIDITSGFNPIIDVVGSRI